MMNNDPTADYCKQMAEFYRNFLEELTLIFYRFYRDCDIPAYIAYKAAKKAAGGIINRKLNNVSKKNFYGA